MTFEAIIRLFDDTTHYPSPTPIPPSQNSDTDNICVVDAYLLRYKGNERNNYLTQRGITNDTIVILV